MAFPSKIRTYKSGYHTVREEESDQIWATNYIKQICPDAIVIGDCIGLITTDNMRIAAMKTRSEEGNPDITIIYPSRGFAGMVIEHKKSGTVLKNKDNTWRKQSYTRKYRKYGKLYIKTGDHIADQVSTLEKYIKNNFFGCFTIGRLRLKRRIDWYFQVPEQTEIF